jgi:F420-0:gamma-glutamyl ligase
MRVKTSLSIYAIQTAVFHLGDSLFDFITSQIAIGQLKEGSVLAVTSKIVSLAEHRLMQKQDIAKADLVRQEADIFLADSVYGTSLTITHGLLIPTAGIDESNSETDAYILYPKDPFSSARILGEKLRREYGLKNLGLILTDSRSTPLRRGVTGIALAHWGFMATQNQIGTADIFGRNLAMTYINVVDALAGAAVYMMGEGSERCPLAIIDGADIEFTNSTEPSEIQIPYQDDIYAPLFIK